MERYCRTFEDRPKSAFTSCYLVCPELTEHTAGSSSRPRGAVVRSHPPNHTDAPVTFDYLYVDR